MRVAAAVHWDCQRFGTFLWRFDVITFSGQTEHNKYIVNCRNMLHMKIYVLHARIWYFVDGPSALEIHFDRMTSVDIFRDICQCHHIGLPLTHSLTEKSLPLLMLPWWRYQLSHYNLFYVCVCWSCCWCWSWCWCWLSVNTQWLDLFQFWVKLFLDSDKQSRKKSQLPLTSSP